MANGILKVGEITTSSGSGNITIGSGVTLQSNVPAFHAYLSSNQNLSNDTVTTIICDTEVFDTNNAYDTSNGRFTPQISGKYFVYSNIHFSGVADGTAIEMEFRKNNTRSSLTNLVRRKSKDGDQSMSTSFVIDLNGSSDYLTLIGKHNSGSTEVAEGSTSFQATYFGAYRLGA
tara:strand:- start:36 stop:557 length:522 start_codon:yes stop_codon:yes gene_type:complete